jgi:hypothetical protein
MAGIIEKEVIINCTDCNKDFTLSVKDQEFYKRIGYVLPKRCLECRKKRRLKREDKRGEKKSESGNRR